VASAKADRLFAPRAGTNCGEGWRPLTAEHSEHAENLNHGWTRMPEAGRRILHCNREDSSERGCVPLRGISRSTCTRQNPAGERPDVLRLDASHTAALRGYSSAAL